MTERPMDEIAPMAEDPHPDEGTIHAWVEHQLGASDTATVETHVHYCRECQARADEARALIAESSRVVTSLDDPSRPFAAPVDELAAARVRAGSSSLWRWARLTPARAAIAASLLVAIGVSLTQRRVGQDVAPTGAKAAVATSPAVAPVQDHLLDSAVARRVAQSQPPRTIEAATSPAMPAPPAPASQLAQPGAGVQVAQGRAEARSVREAAPVAADQSRAGAAGIAAVAEPAATATSAAASNAMRADAPLARRAMAAKASVAGGGTGGLTGGMTPQECYIVEPTSGQAKSWGSLSLPIVVAVRGPASAGAATRAAFVARGDDTTALTWTSTARDSVRAQASFGTLALGPGSDRREGVARTSAESSGVAVRTTAGVRTASAAVQVTARRVVCPGP